MLGYLDDLLIVPLGIPLAVRLIPAMLMDEFRSLAVQRIERPTSRAGMIAVILVWAAPAWDNCPMKFAAIAFVLLASLFASITHGMAAAPACVEMLVVDDRPAAEAAEAGDVADSSDDAHCGFGMMAIDESNVGPREVLAARIGGHATDLLLGRDRMPDQRPPDVTRI